MSGFRVTLNIQQDCTEVDTTYDSTLGDFASEPRLQQAVPADVRGIWAHRCGLVVQDDQQQETEFESQIDQFGEQTWEQGVADEPGSMSGTGATDASYTRLLRSGMVDKVLSRLQTVYPEYSVVLQPGSCYFADPACHNTADCPPVTLNRSSFQEEYNFHIDLDPAGQAPNSMYAQSIGTHVNGLPARPLFVTALVYVVGTWQPRFRAETQFLDPDCESGVFVLPRRNRLVLFSQDLIHSLAPPARAAPHRDSLALRLMLVHKDDTAAPTIHRPDWGVPTIFPRV